MRITIIRRLAMSTLLHVSEVARRLHCRPRDISDLFYQRLLSDERCPVVGGRRLIPFEFVPVIQEVLNRRLRSDTRLGVVR
jgi:hypothetical protein